MYLELKSVIDFIYVFTGKFYIYKIINMLQPAFYDYVFVLPFSLVLLFLTLGFFKNNTTSNLTKSISNDKKKIKTKITKKNYNFVYLKQILTLLFLLFLQNLLYRGYSETL